MIIEKDLIGILKLKEFNRHNFRSYFHMFFYNHTRDEGTNHCPNQICGAVRRGGREINERFGEGFLH